MAEFRLATLCCSSDTIAKILHLFFKGIRAKPRQIDDEMISFINFLKTNGKKARNIFTLCHTNRGSRLDLALKRSLSSLVYSAALIQVLI